MKWFFVTAASGAALCLATISQASMMPMGQMGGSSFMINLVSPPAATTQVRRGILMVGHGMMRSAPMPMMTPGTGGSAAVQIRLILSGVSDQEGFVTSSNNHLYLSGSVTTADAGTQALSIAQPFDMTNGTAMLIVPVGPSGMTAPAVVEIESVTIADDAGNTFAVPGFRIAAPAATATPGMPYPTMTPGMPHATMTPGMGMGPTMTPHMGPGGGMGPGIGGH